MIDVEMLREWQRKAYNNWILGNRKGIFLGCTGSGKSIAALFCIQETDVKTIILVPTIALKNQWIEEISTNLNIVKDDIGVIGDGHYELGFITVAVVNSVRKEDLKEFDMIVLDEVHRYGSLENIKPIKNNEFKYKLGLTATLKRSDGNETELIELIGKVVYVYDTKKAVKDGVLSKFQIINYGINLTELEQIRYDKDTDTITRFSCDNMYEIARRPNHPKRIEALTAIRAISRRKAIINNAENKMEALIKIVKKEQGKKIIIFNETIKLAELEKRLLKKEGFESEIYHSKMKEQDAIERFKNGDSKILVSVKSLNEGLDVKDVDVCIRVAGNSQDRDTIQRLGRGLRVTEGKEIAKYYQIFCLETVEEKMIKKNTDIIKDAAEEVIWKV